MAQMAHDGLACSINPVHTDLDGDTMFAVSTGASHAETDLTTIGSVSAEVVARAVFALCLPPLESPGIQPIAI